MGIDSTPRAADGLRLPARWNWLVALCLLLSGCGASDNGNPGVASKTIVSIENTSVKLGQNVQVRVDQAPEGWFGEITGSCYRHFTIDSQRSSLVSTIQNG